MKISICDLAPVNQVAVSDDVLRLDYESAVDGQADWAWVRPAPAQTPWVVNLHGHGSHGDQLFTRQDIRDQLLPAAGSYGILAPNLRDNAWMAPAAAHDLHALLAWARAEYGAACFLLASGSMGGTGSLIYTALHPEDVCALVALCPATDIGRYLQWCLDRCDGVRAEIAQAIRSAYGADDPADARYEAHSVCRHASRLTMPVAVVHGSNDATIPVSEARQLADRLRDGSSFRYTEIPAGGHEAPLARMADTFAWARSAAGID